MTEKYIEKIDSYCAANAEELKNEFVELLTRFVAEQTVNVAEDKLDHFPYLNVPGEETRVVKHIRAWADKMGFKSETHGRIPERENIVLHFGKGEGRKVFVPCHTDVVPPGDGWDSDPFELQVEGDTVRGRGVMDDKGPLVASLLALKILKESGMEIQGEFQVGGLADEEAMAVDGTDYGLIYMLENGLVDADYGIVPDIGGNMLDIDIAEKGIANFEIKAVGKQAHGSTPEKGVNAIASMAEYLVRLKKHEFQHTPHPVLDSYTVNVGEIQGGAAPNIVAGECRCKIDIRLVPGQSADSVKAELLGLAEGLAADFSVELKMLLESHEIPPESELISAVADMAEHVRGQRPHTMGLGGGTYAKFLNHRGIQSVGFCPGNKDAMHMANEYTSISEHIDFARILALVACKLANSCV